jgi:hypothetical protein
VVVERLATPEPWSVTDEVVMLEAPVVTAVGASGV